MFGKTGQIFDAEELFYPVYLVIKVLMLRKERGRGKEGGVLICSPGPIKTSSSVPQHVVMSWVLYEWAQYAEHRQHLTLTASHLQGEKVSSCSIW